jgi:hypothetical protein
MRNIHVSQLKAESFSLPALIEETISINASDTYQTHADLKEVIADLEGIDEALFFKKEKLSAKLRAIERGMNLEKIDELVQEIKRIDLAPLGTSKDVLERNREINRLKRIEKATRYLIEVEKGNMAVLDALISSDDKDDWCFVCFFLGHAMDSVANQEELLKYSKMIEEKMVEVFEAGQRQHNRAVMRNAYNALLEMNKEASLVQVYIYNLELFKSPIEMRREEESVIDLDFYTNDSSSFLDLISKISETYAGHFTDLRSIFSNAPAVYMSIHKKVYDDLLSPALQDYLKDAPAGLYLLNLESCYKNINVLGSFIETMDPAFDSRAAADDMIAQYISVAISREKDLFSEIYEILVEGRIKPRKYMILGEEAKCSSDYILVYKQLLDVVNSAMLRCERLYGEGDEDELVDFFFRKLSGLLTAISVSVKNNFEVIGIMQFIYLVTKKFFGPKFHKLAFFAEKIERRIQASFNDEVEICNYRAQIRIRKEEFVDADAADELVRILKMKINEAEEMSIRGKNMRVFTEKIFTYVHDRLYEQMLKTTFSRDQGRNMMEYVSGLVEYTKTLGNVEIVQRFVHLRDIGMIMTLSPKDLEDFYGTMVGRIPEEELEKIIRTRTDRETARRIVFKERFIGPQ